MEKIYYYKTISDTWNFSTGVSLGARKANEYLQKLRRTNNVEKLYLNEPKHFELIKSVFFTQNYWNGRTWQDEYYEN